jgi:hypothetical protein
MKPKVLAETTRLMATLGDRKGFLKIHIAGFKHTKENGKLT